MVNRNLNIGMTTASFRRESRAVARSAPARESIVAAKTPQEGVGRERVAELYRNFSARHHKTLARLAE